MDDAYTLFYYPSNASLLPHMMLREIGATFELRLVDRDKGEQRSTELVAEAEATAAAVAANPALAKGVNVVDGHVVLPEVAEAHGMAAVGLQEVLR